MNKPFNQLTDSEAERLALLLEELGEAQQAIGKILRHGYESYHPDALLGYSNRESLMLELGDVFAAVWLMTAYDLDRPFIDKRTRDKLIKVRKYLHHQKNEVTP